MRKSISLAIAFIVFTMSAESFGQTFRIKAGLNLSKMSGKRYGLFTDDYNMKSGFHVGATIEIPLNKLFFIETGMFLSTKGYKIIREEKLWTSIYSLNENLNLFYIDIPLTAKVSFDFGNTNIYGFFGPYIGVGLSGKVKLKEFIPKSGQDNEISIDEVKKVDWGSGRQDDFKRLDYGLNVGTGIGIKSIQISLTYGLGLANISDDTNYDTNTKNKVIGISIGYKFSGK